MVINQIRLNQQDFMKQRSTVSNFALFPQLVCEILDACGQVDVIYTNFVEAFDRIDI